MGKCSGRYGGKLLGARTVAVHAVNRGATGERTIERFDRLDKNMRKCVVQFSICLCLSVRMWENWIAWCNKIIMGDEEKCSSNLR